MPREVLDMSEIKEEKLYMCSTSPVIHHLAFPTIWCQKLKSGTTKALGNIYMLILLATNVSKRIFMQYARR